MNDTQSAKLQLKQLAVIENDSQVRSLRYSPCEEYLYAGGFEGEIRRWKVSSEEAQPLEPLAGHAAWVDGLRFNDSLLLSSDSWGMLAAWPYERGQVTPKAPGPKWQHNTAHGGWIRSLALSADGKRLATAGSDGAVRVWNAADGKLLAEFAGHEHEWFAVALTATGEQVVAADLMAKLKLWDVASGEVIREQRIEQMHMVDRDRDVAALRYLAFHNDDQTLLCCGGQPGNVQRVRGQPLLIMLDGNTWEVNQEYKLGGENDGYLYDHAWHTDGQLMYLTSAGPGQGRMAIEQLGAAQPAYESKMFNPHCLAYAGGKGQVAVSATNRNSQGNGAVLDDEGNYRGNSSPLHIFSIEPAEEAAE